MMPGGAAVWWDTFPPESHGCSWLALIGPSLVGKAGSTYRASSKCWSHRGERRRETRDDVYGYIYVWMTVSSL